MPKDKTPKVRLVPRLPQEVREAIARGGRHTVKTKDQSKRSTRTYDWRKDPNTQDRY